MLITRPMPALEPDRGTFYMRLERGDGIIIKFGGLGEQYVHVVPRRGRNKGIRAWRPSSHSWTKPRLLDPEEIVRAATASDVAYFKPDFGPAWEK